VLLSPWEARDRNGICPVCRKKLTIGVMHRVVELADRKLGFRPENAVQFQHIVPLITVISKVMKKPETSVAVAEEYSKLIRYFGNEFAVFDSSSEQVRLATSAPIADAIIRVKEGRIRWVPGYDGVFGELILDDTAPSKGTVDKKQKSLSDF
jgi:PHP family Zn ribbon phosphoesterase